MSGDDKKKVQLRARPFLSTPCSRILVTGQALGVEGYLRKKYINTLTDG